jgi:hypothetical protein
MFVEDFTPYLQEFGTAGVLDGRAVRGIYEGPYREPMGMASTAPAFSLPAADVGASGPNSTLSVTLPAWAGGGTANFRVVVPEPDGTGWTTLRLERL